MPFLNKHNAKPGLWIGFLVKHHKHVINNLKTKYSLSCADVKQGLMDIDTPKSVHNSALFASKPKGNKKK